MRDSWRATSGVTSRPPVEMRKIRVDPLRPSCTDAPLRGRRFGAVAREGSNAALARCAGGLRQARARRLGSWGANRPLTRVPAHASRQRGARPQSSIPGPDRRVDGPRRYPAGSSRPGASPHRDRARPRRQLRRRVGGARALDVVPAEDCMGEPGCLPVNRPRMRLGHRVVSLLLSHRLTSPDEFESTWSALPLLREELDVDERWTQTA